MFRINTDLASLTQDDGYMGKTLIGYLRLDQRQRKPTEEDAPYCEYGEDERDNLEER